MKHVGVNVAADSLMTLSYTGVGAGLVLVSADDPGAFSSQNEQDNRHYARFAKIPCLEPADSQEARDFTILAFDLSEQFDTPVLLRTTTRISHSKSVVEVAMPTTTDQARAERPPQPFPRQPQKYVMIPANARRRHPVVEERLQKLVAYAETTPLNRSEWRDKKIGIITGGIAYQYAREVFPEASILKLGLSYPLPPQLIREFAASVERLVVIEELDPFFEEQVRALGLPAIGKEIFHLTGELTVGIVREAAIKSGLTADNAIGHRPSAISYLPSANLPARPPALCPGCPHRSVFYLLRKHKLLVSGDIGCYGIGVLPPFTAMDALISMGASIGMAHGMERAGIGEKLVAVIGDSTFFHAGLPALANVVYNQGTTATLILDNYTTGMTGGQDNPGTGKTLQGEKTTRLDIAKIVRAMEVEDLWVVEAFDVPAVEQAIAAAVEVPRPAVVIVRGSCVLLAEYRPKPSVTVEAARCNGCTVCFRVGCPAILKSEERDTKTNRPKALINPLLCVGCDVCRQVCPWKAIYRQVADG
jgi:indolepyruvate ferredoxin oxidoreductase alpha subunit